MVLIFDLDGTLADPREGITRCIEYALERLGAHVPPLNELERFIGPPLREGFASILGGHEKVEHAVTLYRERYGTTGIFENQMYAGMVETLEHLRRRGTTMLIATSKPREYAERIIGHFGLATLFARVYGSEMSGERSDKTELLAHLLERESWRVPAVMIGDREYDIIAARNNGLRSIGVKWGFGSEEELRKAGADHICSSPADLLAAVDLL